MDAASKCYNKNHNTAHTLGSLVVSKQTQRKLDGDPTLRCDRNILNVGARALAKTHRVQFGGAPKADGLCDCCCYELVHRETLPFVGTLKS
jgi:hypothetical protein